MTPALAVNDAMDQAATLLSFRSSSGQQGTHKTTMTDNYSNGLNPMEEVVDAPAPEVAPTCPPPPPPAVEKPQGPQLPGRQATEAADAASSSNYNSTTNSNHGSSSNCSSKKDKRAFSTSTNTEQIYFEELPSTADGARVQLEIMFALDEWNETGDLDHVVETLTVFPSLASELFADHHGCVWTPLAHVMMARADLETTQEIYQLYPEALAVPVGGPEQNLPLHLACGFDHYDDVTEFLVRMYPRALTLYNGAGLLPLHRLMAKKRLARAAEPATFAMMRTFIDIYPPSVGIPSLTGVTPLDYAFHEGYDVFVLHYFLNHLPLVMPQFTVHPSHHGKPVQIDLNKARILEKLMPHFQCIHCEPASWTMEAMLYMIHTIQTNPATTNQFRLKLPPALTSECRFALKQAIELNSNMLQLALTCHEQEVNKDNSLTLQALREGLAKCTNSNGTTTTSNLQVLQLLQYQGRMLELITNPTHLKVVELSQVAFTDDPNLWVPRKDLLSKSHMQRLTLSACSISAECLRKLLTNLVYMPNLLQLSVDVTGPDPKLMDVDLDVNVNVDNSSESKNNNNNDGENKEKQFDMTTPIVEILKQNKLQTLNVGTYPKLDMTDSFYDTLRHNHALQVFRANTLTNEHLLADVLRRHNTTLFQVQSAHAHINYYASLNACGRTKARDVTITRKQYVELLEAVAMVNVIDEQRKHIILYGLLRECPDQWCGCLRSERRRSRASSPDSLCGKRKM